MSWLLYRHIESRRKAWRYRTWVDVTTPPTIYFEQREGIQKNTWCVRLPTFKISSTRTTLANEQEIVGGFKLAADLMKFLIKHYGDRLYALHLPLLKAQLRQEMMRVYGTRIEDN